MQVRGLLQSANRVGYAHAYDCIRDVVSLGRVAKNLDEVEEVQLLPYVNGN